MSHLKSAFFSLLIPTKDRSAYLADLLRSVFAQDFEDFEVIVSNNGCDQATRGVVQRYAGESRLQYIEQKTPLNMPTHWNKISDYVNGDYMLVLTDRSVLKKGALSELKKVITQNELPLIISWPWDMYYEDLKILRPYGKKNDGFEILESDDKLKDFAMGMTEFPYFLPRGLNSAVKTSLIKDLKEKYDILFCTINPDFTFAFLCLLNSENFIFLSKSLMIFQGTGISNGGNSNTGSASEYIKNLDLEKVFKNTPCDAHLVSNTIHEDFLEMLSICDRSDLVRYWNKAFYYKECLAEIDRKYEYGKLKSERINQLEYNVITTLQKESVDLKREVMSDRKGTIIRRNAFKIARKIIPSFLMSQIKRFVYRKVYLSENVENIHKAAGFEEQLEKKIKVHYFAPFPVFYHACIYRELAKNPSLVFKVFYEEDTGITPVYIDEFKETLKSDVDLLSGYNYEFLDSFSPFKWGGFLSAINPQLFGKLLERPDVAIVHGYSRLGNWIIFLMARLLGIKVIMKGEATLRGNENKRSLKQLAKNVIVNLSIKSSDAIVYSCHGNRIFWEHYGADSGKLFPMSSCVDNEFYRSNYESLKESKPALRKDLGIPENNLVILFPSRFTTRKRPMDLLEAVAKSVNKINFTILFVGNGPELCAMQEAVKKNDVNAIFTGYANTSEISKFFVMADVCTVISEYDPSPKIVNEAMNFSLPVIATNIIGNSVDYIKDNFNGFTIDVGDVEKLSNRLDLLYEDKEMRELMGERSFSLIESINGNLNQRQYFTAVDFVCRAE